MNISEHIEKLTLNPVNTLEVACLLRIVKAASAVEFAEACKKLVFALITNYSQLYDREYH